MMDATTQVQGYVLLTLRFHREGRDWVGVCLELGTSTFDRSLEKTRRMLSELVLDHLNLLEEEGERERFFKEHGVTVHTEIPTSALIPSPSSADDSGEAYFQSKMVPVPAYAG